MTFAAVGFRADLATLFPDESTKRAGRMLDVSQRAVQRWKTEGDIPPAINTEMKNQVEKLEASDVIAEIDRIVAIAREIGLHDEVIAARLSHVADGLLGRDVP